MYSKLTLFLLYYNVNKVNIIRQKNGFSFLTYVVSLRSLEKKMRLLIFKVSIEMCGLIGVIRLLIFGGNVCVFSGTLYFNNFEFVLLSFAISAVFIPLFNLNNIASYIFFRLGLFYIIFRLFIFWIFLSSLVMRDSFADYI